MLLPPRSLPFVYYLISLVVLSLYEFRLVGFDGGTSAGWSVAMFASLFLIAAVARLLFDRWTPDTGEVLSFSRRQVAFEGGLYLAVGLAALTGEVLIFGHPGDMGIRVLLSVLVLGFFASIDNALTRGRVEFAEAAPGSAPGFQGTPLARKLTVFVILVILISTLATSLTMLDHLSLLARGQDLASARQAILLDLFRTFGLILVLCLRLLYSYSLTLQQIFGAHIQVLLNVQAGDLSKGVPVMTRDEFGFIAEQTNRMIDELKAKAKLHETLERVVSPSILEKLLGEDQKILKQGQEHNVAILFCDLREFTSFTENAPAEHVIMFLNAYFSEIARIVAEHNGIVNKFMGDGILAVYGMEGDSNPVEDAVAASWAILEHANQLRAPDGTRMGFGIGIHSGTVVAGTIGSEDRYEYTFIGDAVNTASRLDGLSKRLGCRIVISSDAYEMLGQDSREWFEDLGLQRVRGKKDPLRVFGAG